MCGIIAYTGYRDATSILISGLRRLEYRGYDSAGIALLTRGKIRQIKAEGKLPNLVNKLPEKLPGKTGIGHTRWATHGIANDENAHPHSDADGHIALVHNGIIENATELRKDLIEKGCQFSSDTDSEVLVHLICQYLSDSSSLISLVDAVRQALLKVRGTYGLAVINKATPGEIVAARNGSPVIIGIGDKEMFVSSDSSAIVSYTKEIVHLEDGELAHISAGGFSLSTLNSQPLTRTSTTLDIDVESLEHDGFPNFMLKEIFEQGDSIERTLRGRLDRQFNTSKLGGLNLSARELLDVKRIKILACGSAYYAGICGANIIEQYARIPSSAEPAAEFRYRNPIIEFDTLYIVVSQSGETYDTLAALREVQRKGGRVLGINNVVGSSIAREVDGGIYMHSGPEVSVASTKAVNSMLVAFMLLAVNFGRVRDISPQGGAKLLDALESLPQLCRQTLSLAPVIEKLAKKYSKVNNAFFIGRTDAYPVALEGAQKLKEISYIHAEAYPSSELKHGPLALVDENTPTILVLPDNNLLEKSLSALHEISARNGKTITVTDSSHPSILELSTDVITIPSSHALIYPVIMNIALQLFAYYSAIDLGRNVDQPRNLAKSVTVE